MVTHGPLKPAGWRRACVCVLVRVGGSTPWHGRGRAAVFGAGCCLPGAGAGAPHEAGSRAHSWLVACLVEAVLREFCITECFHFPEKKLEQNFIR